MNAFPLRVVPGTDLRREIERVAATMPEHSAFVLAGIGSLVEARLRFAAADEPTTFVEPLELIALSGSVAREGAHLHACVSTASGAVHGGHLGYGCIVRTTAEVLIGAPTGWRLARAFDAATGYDELVVTPAAQEDAA